MPGVAITNVIEIDDRSAVVVYHKQLVVHIDGCGLRNLTFRVHNSTPKEPICTAIILFRRSIGHTIASIFLNIDYE